MYDLYKEAGMPYEWQERIKEACDQYGIDFLSTAFGRKAVDFLKKNSFHTEQISYEEHASWFAQMMAADQVRQFILMDQDQPVGQIRIRL